MPYLIGTDEAGYGPNLGPLVIAASVWRISNNLPSCDLYQLLRKAVCSTAAKASNARLAIADSKLLYSSAGGIGALERGVLAVLGMLAVPSQTCVDLWRHLAADDCHQFDGLPWHDGWNHELPAACAPADIATISALLQQACAAAKIELVALRATAIFPARFNALIDLHGSKGEALSRATLNLVGHCLQSLDAEPVTIVCDKHGGRARYQRLLQLQFPDPLIEVVGEGPAESSYRWGPVPARVQIHFRAGGESFLPAALASMTAKYLRELAMHAFNAFWQTQVEGLKPTAGYPLDARRFKREIAAAQTALGIGDDLLWRQR
jgi:ribonuclease HII